MEEVKENLFGDGKKKEPSRGSRRRYRRRKEKKQDSRPESPAPAVQPPVGEPVDDDSDVRTIIIGDVSETASRTRAVAPPSPTESVCSFASGVCPIELSPPPAEPEPVQELVPAPQVEIPCPLPCGTPPRKVQVQAPPVIDELVVEPREETEDRAVTIIDLGPARPASPAWRLIRVEVPVGPAVTQLAVGIPAAGQVPENQGTSVGSTS